ncbi:SGNH/GDSL hydrolase family protein [Mycolicibacterium smegmatis]|uniref:SGNH/GDSL hydrolase family protein n=1 Tax=Mycolicibacterium smegmatis TaxID=1772 RepID=UPI001CBDC910|nr:SGNH/GDSL hydrolase family protein [Mycolicibacterium smegmatis]MCC3336494.1 SGNH/GDSL hydrolase family protein [Mycolicibacterium smegmatis]MCO4191866.1 SGNH/GDSL hydrolase family protein [Mycolicibacterium smegmatis]MDF1901733.1 SGNH/GDSL hydrolase family protein [Mycolicibacterium smegmatis]MDF1908077.1 SGNH/GDSL hydrolase family protein [Mycolicibacterium smegmatis]MDF1920589.1 SGNH/GDSL hydrolase family protein [Mycolicibacterium smegmatis]
MTIAVIGDQNTAGIKNRVVWPTLMAARNGWSVSNYALPESGFAADGMGGQAFRYQVERAQAQHPRVILLMTGTADASVPEMTAVTVGAVEAINKVIRGGQQVAVVGPFWYETPVPESVRRVDDAVRKAAAQTGVPYFDALDPPLFTRAQMHPDRTGPSDEGQSIAADKIATWLRTQVLK